VNGRATRRRRSQAGGAVTSSNCRVASEKGRSPSSSTCHWPLATRQYAQNRVVVRVGVGAGAGETRSGTPPKPSSPRSERPGGLGPAANFPARPAGGAANRVLSRFGKWYCKQFEWDCLRKEACQHAQAAPQVEEGEPRPATRQRQSAKGEAQESPHLMCCLQHPPALDFTPAEGFEAWPGKSSSSTCRSSISTT
jgi:hypothetical protein